MGQQWNSIENVYTADGKKLSRTTNGETTYYVYDGNVVIEEQDAENEESARNVYGRNLITRETSDNKVVYGFNGHGDVVYYTNLDNIVLVVYDYDEFGNVIREENVVNSVSTLLPSIAGSTETATETIWSSIESIDNPYRYAGYEYIEEVGLYDLNARYYNPEIARFLSQDPYYNLGNRVIGLYEINVPNAWSIIQANNIYAYCGNNPVIFADKSGKSLFAVFVVGAVVLLKVVDYAWTAIDVADSANTLANKKADKVDKFFAAANITLSIGFELAEPDDLLPINIPLDDVARKTALETIQKLYKEKGPVKVKNYLRDNFGEAATDSINYLDEIIDGSIDSTKSWGKGSFDTVKDSLVDHYYKHGKGVGATDVSNYLNKAEGFKANLKNSKKYVANGYTEGSIKYVKNGKYIILGPDKEILSFGIVD